MLTDLAESTVLGFSQSRYDTTAIAEALRATLGPGPIVPAGSRVLLKPNWVHHMNQGSGGIEALVTQTALVSAVLELLTDDQPESVVVGDAPIQGCDFNRLASALHLDEMERSFRRKFNNFNLVDFRRTARSGESMGASIATELRPECDYVLFDLGMDSLLDPITLGADFRVTMYDPRALSRTHRPGRHQYLVARDVIESDLIIDLPKLKTHRKSGITGSLKNMVGVNGNKDYLAHHRKGGRGRGDNYQGVRPLKRAAEELLDAANRADGGLVRGVLGVLANDLVRADRLFGGDGNIDGSWYGNDTVWRMALDLVRIVIYGRADGSMANQPQRLVVTIADGIVAGDGEGPLAPSAVPLGLVTIGSNPAAVEWVHALLMGFDPRSIPITREAFGAFRWPVADFKPQSINVEIDGKPVALDDVWTLGRPFTPPENWVGHLERTRC